VTKIDIQGRSYDATEKHLLANLKHSPVAFIPELYWHPECITYDEPTDDTYCDFLLQREIEECLYWIPPTPECLTARALYWSVCGQPIIDVSEGSGESSPAEGSGESG